MNKHKGGFIISLDFELMWGVRDVATTDTYGQPIQNVHTIIPRMLELFKKYNIRATWATVGLLFTEDLNDIDQFAPKLHPSYSDSNLSPYTDLEQVKNDLSNSYYFGYNLIKLIRDQYPEQEISTHTFSHYYCLEDGQKVEEFNEDIKAAVSIANRKNITIKSIVFPRNQQNDNYLQVCKNNGITSYRGVEKAWFYSAEKGNSVTKKKRAFRLLDAYLNISGHNTFIPKQENGIVDIPASRFFRPYFPKLSFLEQQKINRIKKGLKYAAKNNEYFHLWWHPHNFGANIEQNFKQLEEILSYVSTLNSNYGFESYTMTEVANIELKQ